MSDHDATKTCRHCAETINAAAKVCPHCRFWQKQWSLQNPQVTVSLFFAVIFFTLIGLAMYMDNTLHRNEEFAINRDQISVVGSQFSLRFSGSNLLVTVVGTLTNRSNVGWKDVAVEAQFLDKSGKLFDAITANADDFRGVTILPHEVAAFKIEGRAARPESEYGSCNVAVRWAKDVNGW